MDDIPYGYCGCGCGQKTDIAPYSSRQRQCVRGQPFRFIQGHHAINVNQEPSSRLTFPENFWFHVDRRGEDECWEWQGTRENRKWDYGVFYNKGETRKAHQVSYELAYGKIPDGLNVLHKCDNPPCVNPKHLFLGTDGDNVHDMMSKGRNVVLQGSEIGNSKLTEEQVAEICQLLCNHVPYRLIAKMFGVSVHPIYAIANGKIWRHITS